MMKYVIAAIVLLILIIDLIFNSGTITSILCGSLLMFVIIGMIAVWVDKKRGVGADE